MNEKYLSLRPKRITMKPKRLYTAGMAEFENIRKQGRIYVDKTDLIYQLTQESQYVFLSRPRRFGKSLLSCFPQIFFLKKLSICKQAF